MGHPDRREGAGDGRREAQGSGQQSRSQAPHDALRGSGAGARRTPETSAIAATRW